MKTQTILQHRFKKGQSAGRNAAHLSKGALGPAPRPSKACSAPVEATTVDLARFSTGSEHWFRDRNVGQSNFLERRCAAFVEEQVDKSWYRRAESADKATDHGENATVDHASPEAPALIVASPVLLLVVTGAAVLPCYRPTLGRVRNRKRLGAAK